MRINAKYIGCAGIILSAALVIVPLTLHNLAHIGFFTGLWHGFAFVPRLLAQLVVDDLPLIAATNPLYAVGYAIGLTTTSVLVYKQITKPQHD